MKSKVCFLVLGALLASSAAGQRSATVTPKRVFRVELFGPTLSFMLPEKMQLVTNQRNTVNLLMEFIPQGQSLATWTRMVTIQAYRGLGRSPEPTAAIARRAFYPAACRNGPIYRDGGERTLAGDLKRSVIANGCASLPAGAYPLAMKGAGEQDFIYVFRDRETIYTLNYAERGAPFAGKAPPRNVDSGDALLREMFGEVTLTYTH